MFNPLGRIDSTNKIGWTTAMVLTFALLLPALARAHCDSLDGPVVLDARTALKDGDVTPVLKWVPAEDEEQIRSAFDHALEVRQLGDEARELADRYFFETLVRVHRAGEGAPFTGLKPPGSTEPAIVRADRALESGSVEGLAESLSEHVAEGLRERHARAAQARRHAGESVEAGREYVEAYTLYVHYVEGLARVVHGGAGHGRAHP